MSPRHVLFVLPIFLLGGWLLMRWSVLPEHFATSFDFAGRPRDSSGRGTFAGLALAVVGAMSLLYGLITAGIERLPERLINIPDREYWLAPERRAPTLRRVARLVEVLGLGTLACMVILFVGIGESAIHGAERFHPAWLAAPALVILGTGIGLVWLLTPIWSRRRHARGVR